MPKYEVTYIIKSDASDVIAFQTRPEYGHSTPLWYAIETGEGIESVNVRELEDQ